MYRSVCCPIPQLLQRLSAILEDLAIDGFELTIRGQDANETGYPVNCRARLSFAFTQCLFGPLTLGQIDHERNSLVATFFKQRATNKHGNAATIFAEILLFERLPGSGCGQ